MARGFPDALNAGVRAAPFLRVTETVHRRDTEAAVCVGGLDVLAPIPHEDKTLRAHSFQYQADHLLLVGVTRAPGVYLLEQVSQAVVANKRFDIRFRAVGSQGQGIPPGLQFRKNLARARIQFPVLPIKRNSRSLVVSKRLRNPGRTQACQPRFVVFHRLAEEGTDSVTGWRR